MSETKPRLALDMYVLAQGVRTGIYRVCAELFPLLAQSPLFSPKILCRSEYDAGTQRYFARSSSLAQVHRIGGGKPSADADILLSPFGVAPAEWITDADVLKAHIIYDLIAIKHPEYFSEVAANEVRSIVESLDEHTVVFAISEFTKADLLECRPDLNPDQVVVIPLAAGNSFEPCTDNAEKVRVRERYGIPAEVPYVLSLATLEVRKNLHRVVDAFVHFLSLHPTSPLHLVLAGMQGWKLEQLDSALSAAGAWRERIVMTGFVEDADLSALYSDAVCFVYLSRYEGFGLPPLEAMACGTPVISANNSSLPEVVSDAGLLFDADDVGGVANAMERLIQSTGLRAQLAEAGIRRAALFDWKDCAAIVLRTLVSAYAIHARQPYNRRMRDLAPGAIPIRFNQKAPIEANILEYQNGSRGPNFCADKSASSMRVVDWPKWADALPPSIVVGRIEGGLRMLGDLKSGSVEHPLVSYVTVVRNSAETLERTIRSVQAQTYSNVEHIVLDGASTDGTLDLIRQYADKLDYFASEPDRNLYDALNKAIPIARGQLICVLNADDWLEPRAAEIAVHRLRGQEETALLLTTAHVLVEPGKVYEWNPSFVHPGCYFSCANDCHNGIYAKRAVYERTGPYDISFKIVADFKWIMTCIETGVSFVYSREPTVNYSMGGTSGDVRQHSVECIRVVRERFPFLTETELSGLYHCFFELGGSVRELEPNRPANMTEMVRAMFSTFQDRPDFIHALMWAVMAKFEHPADARQIIATSPMPASDKPLTMRGAMKELAKSVLYKFPRLYALVVRGYVRFQG